MPILLALILGPMAEQNVRLALLISHGDPSIFVTRPIFITFLLLAVLVTISSYRKMKKLRAMAEQLTQESDA